MNNGKGPLDIESLGASFSTVYQDLVSERPVTCAKTAAVHAAVPGPDAVILDVSNLSGSGFVLPC